MLIRSASAGIAAVGIAAGVAVAQTMTEEVQQGHHLALTICANCHVAATDQPFEPILRPPAPAFMAIARRSTTTEESVGKFLTTTHRDIGSPAGMPNPQLLDFQIKQVSAYLLSLRKQ